LAYFSVLKKETVSFFETSVDLDYRIATAAKTSNPKKKVEVYLKGKWIKDGENDINSTQYKDRRTE
jgi:hypothetical protein